MLPRRAAGEANKCWKNARSSLAEQKRLPFACKTHGEERGKAPGSRAPMAKCAIRPLTDRGLAVHAFQQARATFTATTTNWARPACAIGCLSITDPGDSDTLRSAGARRYRGVVFDLCGGVRRVGRVKSRPMVLPDRSQTGGGPNDDNDNDDDDDRLPAMLRAKCRTPCAIMFRCMPGGPSRLHAK